MSIELRKPELAKFVAEQVRAGHFPDEQAVVEDAVARMMEEQEQAETLTDEDVREIELAQQEIERGEFVDFDVFATEMRKKYHVE
jgi:Arc/MetJ-type ribon-helix-helix transcriptional regulator